MSAPESCGIECEPTICWLCGRGGADYVHRTPMGDRWAHLNCVVLRAACPRPQPAAVQIELPLGVEK